MKKKSLKESFNSEGDYLLKKGKFQKLYNELNVVMPLVQRKASNRYLEYLRLFEHIYFILSDSSDKLIDAVKGNWNEDEGDFDYEYFIKRDYSDLLRKLSQLTKKQSFNDLLDDLNDNIHYKGEGIEVNQKIRELIETCMNILIPYVYKNYK